MGVIAQGRVQCSYHGLTFDGTGACVHNPHGRIYSALAVQAFPVAEAHRALWVWMGEAADADPALIPDLSFLDDAPNTAFSSGYMLGKADYRLYVDNIMDLSHTDYLHPDTLGGAFTGACQEVREDARTVTVRWDVSGVPPLAAQINLGVFPADTLVNRRTEVCWFAPGAMSLINSTTLVDSKDKKAVSSNCHVMTPGEHGEVHYFFGSTRDFLVENVEFNERFALMRDRVFATEDGPMIDGAYRNMRGRKLEVLRPALLSIDKAAAMVRYKLSALITSEQAAPMAKEQDGPLKRQPNMIPELQSS